MLHHFYIAILLISFNTLFAQSQTDLKKYRYANPDSAKYVRRANERNFVRKIRPTERFDLVYNNGFLVTTNMIDTIPLRSASSGSQYFGFSYNLIASPRWIFKFQTGICYYGFSFINVPKKQHTALFTFESDSVSNKKLQMTYLDFPLSIAYVWKRDTTKGKFISMIEFGPTIGFQLSSSFSFDQMLNGKTARINFSGIPDLNPLKLGLYTKISYGIVGLWVYYRLNPVFQSNARIHNSENHYPKFSGLEIGFSIIL
jgi:hypothetical protein